ncbi:alpha/beta hydrolase [Ralstonia solanacearum]|uniref:alpha/beta hydrolase n=1 Tax=Ralstonia solanacearum TaxID=305 RepID=UPI0005ACF930|nr:alpha/beta hydrolase [Ralstonia solanacearum]
MQSIFSVRPDIEPEDFDHCPLLLAHPGDDRWTSFESSRQFFDRIKGDKELVMLENCGHFPVEEPGITQLERASIRFLGEIASNRSRS